MVKRLFAAAALALGIAFLAAYFVSAQFITPHNAGGSVNTAVATSDLLHICQPSASTVAPICPVDTLGADETILAGKEDLVP